MSNHRIISILNLINICSIEVKKLMSNRKKLKNKEIVPTEIKESKNDNSEVKKEIEKTKSIPWI